MKKFVCNIAMVLIICSCSNEIPQNNESLTNQTKGFGDCCCKPTNLKLTGDMSNMLNISWSDIHTDNIFLPPHNSVSQTHLFQYEIDKAKMKVTIQNLNDYTEQTILQTTSPCTGYYAMGPEFSCCVTVSCSHGESVSSYYHMGQGQSESLCKYKYPQVNGSYSYIDDSNYSYIIFNLRSIAYDEHPNSGKTYRVFAYRGNIFSPIPGGDCFFDGYIELNKDSEQMLRIPVYFENMYPESFVRLELKNSSCEHYSRHYLEIMAPISTNLSGSFISEDKFNKFN